MRLGQTISIMEKQKQKPERGFCVHGWIRLSSNAIYALLEMTNQVE